MKLFLIGVIGKLVIVYMVIGQFNGVMVLVIVCIGYVNFGMLLLYIDVKVDDELGIVVFGVVMVIMLGVIDGGYVGVDLNFKYMVVLICGSNVLFINLFMQVEEDGFMFDYGQVMLGLLNVKIILLSGVSYLFVLGVVIVMGGLYVVLIQGMVNGGVMLMLVNLMMLLILYFGVGVQISKQ